MMLPAHTGAPSLSFNQQRLYMERVATLLDTLGIGASYLETSQLPVQMEATELVSIGTDIYQRDQRMLSEAALAWHQMQEAAALDQVNLQVVSAYRSVDYQANIIRRKLSKGEPIEKILSVSAAPGYSEHHTGRAVDITTAGSPVLEEAFEDTNAFAWLTINAGLFGFKLSFPRDNPFGVIYEPWHWAWNGQAQAPVDPSLLNV
jgi:D-alanyl-D-alanine carboxypeptidase